MNLWNLACLVACFVGALAHAQGVFEDCCLNYHAQVNWLVLRRARDYRVQDVSGSCNLPAVIFYFPQAKKMVCGNPRDLTVQKARRFLEQRAKTLQKLGHSARMAFPGSPARRKKMHHGVPKALPSKLKDHSSGGGKRNASLSQASL